MKGKLDKTILFREKDFQNLLQANKPYYVTCTFFSIRVTCIFRLFVLFRGILSALELYSFINKKSLHYLILYELV